MIATAPTAADYQAAFDKERAVTYPMVDAFEAGCGYALDRERLESAARVLACPIKKSPPNWQHGRVLYAAARKYLANWPNGMVAQILDIGTAKGFSALCLLWALQDSRKSGEVTSVDVNDPNARVRRKTVAEVDGLLTLAETLAPWPEAASIYFECSTGIDWLTAESDRVHIAFVDGKHAIEVVTAEGLLISAYQKRGDLAIFDDVHIPDVQTAVNRLGGLYAFEYLDVLPTRSYAIGVRL